MTYPLSGSHFHVKKDLHCGTPPILLSVITTKLLKLRKNLFENSTEDLQLERGFNRPLCAKSGTLFDVRN